jgi:GNAT superfamily N-acetyltransferase
VSLVDLRDREAESAVAALVCTSDHDVEGVLLGWEAEGEVLGCVRLARQSPDEIRLTLLGVARSADRAVVGSALIEAIAGVATANLLVAEAAATDVAWLERCGFTEADALGDGRMRCIRLLDPIAALPEAVAAMSLTDLERAIAQAWGRDTSDDPGEWSEDNRARGQCGVTALLVRELLGGEILIANVLRNGRRVERHAWNRLPSGLTVDLTRTQFRGDERLEQPAVQDPLVMTGIPERYELLAQRVRTALGLCLDPVGLTYGHVAHTDHEG